MTPQNEERLVLAIERIAGLLEAYLPTRDTSSEPLQPRLSKPQNQKSALTISHRHGQEANPVELSHLSVRPEVTKVQPPQQNSTESSHETGSRVLAQLTDLGFTVQKTATPNTLDHALAMTALFMGEHFPALKEFLGRVKSALGYHGPFTLDLKGLPADVITQNCKLGTYLYKIAFLESYQYQKAPRCLINARPSPMPAAQRFLTGQWFEMFCREKALGLLREAGLDSRLDYLRNVQAKLPDGDEFEFDFLLMVDDELFWFEQKTGSYQRQLERYANLVQTMGLDAGHAFLVLLDVEEETSQVLGELCKMTVCDVENFEPTLQTIIDRLHTLPTDGTDYDPDAELVFHAVPQERLEEGLDN